MEAAAAAGVVAVATVEAVAAVVMLIVVAAAAAAAAAAIAFIARREVPIICYAAVQRAHRSRNYQKCSLLGNRSKICGLLALSYLSLYVKTHPSMCGNMVAHRSYLMP